MTIEDRKQYSRVLMENAYQCLKTAKFNVEINDYKAAANRSYYAIFNAIRALLILDDVQERSKHSGLIALFQQHYLKTDILDRRLSRIVTDAFEVRNEADYDVTYLISKEEVLEQIKRAEEFLKAISAYLTERED